MTLYLDSADLDEARTARALGFVAGCTTNPALLARAGHRKPLEAIRQLAGLFSGTVFYQVMENSPTPQPKPAAATTPTLPQNTKH